MSMTSGITFVFIRPPCHHVRRERRVRAGVQVRRHPDRRQSRRACRRSRSGSSSACLQLVVEVRARRPGRATARGTAASAGSRRGVARRRRQRSARCPIRNGIEPCPGVPRTRSRRHATPFSATVTPMLRRLRAAGVEAAALGQQVVVRIDSGWWSATQRAPCALPASSSATAK